MAPTDVPIPPAIEVLFLEDDPRDRGLVVDTLEQSGIRCSLHTARDKAEFKRQLTAQPYDLILSDYTVPGFGGAEALALARNHAPSTPFIFVSGTIGEQKAIDSLKNGATDYVLKERMERLVPAIQRALEESKQRQKRHEAETQLQQSEARFRLMAENIREVFWNTSPDGTEINYVSPAYEKIWGRSLSELRENPLIWLEAVHENDSAKVRDALQKLAQGTPCLLEYKIYRPDGTIRWVEDHGYPVRDKAGAIECIVGVAMDISDRKNLQVQLMQAQKMEAIGQLAGGVAHDFNNTLTVINGYSKLLLDSGNLAPQTAERLRTIYAAGTRASNLTRQLLLFSRKHQIHKHVINLASLIDELAKMLLRLIGEDIRLDLQLDRAELAVTADPGMIEQIVVNLVVNARDAMPQGGDLTIAATVVVLNATDAAQKSMRRPGEFVRLSVRDTGTGISPDILPRIFEPFFTTKPAGVGTGLGLATVFGIAQDHHGWVEVHSTPGKGTTFDVYLPCAQMAEVAAVRGSETPFGRKGRETILLVEDEVSVREFAVAVLQNDGYRILQAGSGVQALESWKWHHDRISLVITDVVMPDGMSGLDLVEVLRTQRPDLKVILTSGYTDEKAQAMFAAREKLPFLQKPYLPNSLSRIVGEVLDAPPPSPKAPRMAP